MFRRRFTFVQASRTTADVEGHDKSARGGLSLYAASSKDA